MNKEIWVGLIFLTLTAAYTLAFEIVEGKDALTSLYWTVITMATIGYGDVTPQTIAGKILAMMMAVTGIAIYTAFASIIVEHVTEKNIKRIQGLLAVKNRNHVVIVGWNEATKEALRELEANGFDVVIVSERPVDHECVVGDVTDEETLKKAGVERAKFVVISTGDDSKNALATLTVRKINPDAVIVAEASKAENVDLLKFAGAKSVVLSMGFAGRLLASAVFEESVVAFFEDVSASYYSNDVFEISAKGFEDMSVLDAMLKLKREFNYLLVGIVRDSVIVNPKHDERIRRGDRLLVIGKRSNA